MNPSNFNSAPQGYMDQTTASLLSQLYPTQQQTYTPPVEATKPKQEKKGNFLTRLLPTVGGLGGGAAGAALGSAILPGVGTILGGILGAGLGSGGAKAGENVIEGGNVGNDVVREGVMGAGGQAVGLGLGKLASGVLGKVGSGLTKAATSRTEARAGAEAAQRLADAFPEKALTPKLKTQLGFGKSIDLANQLGIPLTPEGFIQAQGAATGSNGFLNGILDNLLRQSGKVDLTGYGDVVKQALAKHPELGSLEALSGKGGLPKTAANTATNTQKLFNDMLQQTGLGGQGAIGRGIQTESDKALDLLRQVGNLGQKYAGSAPGTEGAALKNVYDTVYQNLRSTIYNRPEVAKAVAAFKAAPQDIAAVTKAAGDNGKLAQFLVDTVNNAKQASDILGPQFQFINMGKAGETAQKYLQNVVGTSAEARAAMEGAQGPIDRLGNAALGGLLGKVGIGGAAMTGNPAFLAATIPEVINSPIVKSAQDKVIDKLASGGIQKGTAKVIAPALLGTSQFLAHAPNYVPPAQTGGDLQGGAQGGFDMAPQGMTNSGFESPNQQALQAALIGLQNPYMASDFAPLVNSLLTGPLQKSSSAETALQGAQQAFEQAGGGQGLFGGLLSKLGGAVTGGPSRAYGAQRAQLASQLAALGVPASAIPDLTDTSPAAAQQWATLENLIGSFGGQGLLGSVPA